MWIRYIVLFSVVAMLISIMIMLIVETVQTTKSISRKRRKKTN